MLLKPSSSSYLFWNKLRCVKGGKVSMWPLTSTALTASSSAVSKLQIAHSILDKCRTPAREQWWMWLCCARGMRCSFFISPEAGGAKRSSLPCRKAQFHRTHAWLKMSEVIRVNERRHSREEPRTRTLSLWLPLISASNVELCVTHTHCIQVHYFVPQASGTCSRATCCVKSNIYCTKLNYRWWMVWELRWNYT